MSSRRAAFALGVFIALAIVWTWPLATHLSSRVPHDLGDPLLNTWILWWNAHAVPFTASWWSPPILVPVRGALALSEHLAGLGLFSTPIQLLGGSPLAAYNASLLLSYALSGWFAYLLVLRLSGSVAPSLVAGLAFATTPYRAGQLAHLQVLTSQWMPAMFLALHAYADTRQRRWLVLLALAWLLQATSNGYFLLFLPVLVALWLAWFVDWRRTPRVGLAMAATLVVASLPLVPALLEYRHVHSALGLGRQAGEIARFSASAASFTHASPMLRFWPTTAVPTQEDYLFPGVTALLLIVLAGVGAVWKRLASELTPAAPQQPAARVFAFYVVASVAMWACALGQAWTPVSRVGGDRIGCWRCCPDSMDCGCRRALRCSRRSADRLRQVWRSLAYARWSAGPFRRSCSRRSPASRSTARWIRCRSRRATARPASGGRRRRPRASGRRRPGECGGDVSGHGARAADCQRLLGLLSAALHDPVARPAPRRCVAARRAGRRPAPDHRGQRRIRRGGRLQAPGRGRARHRAFRGDERRNRVPARRPAARGRSTRWLSARVPSPRGRRPAADLDSARPQIVRAVTVNLRWRYQELGERVRIDRSDDGQVWEEAWLGWTGALAVAGALTNPLKVPLTIPLKDIKTRYLRVYPSPYWLAREISVSGP